MDVITAGQAIDTGNANSYTGGMVFSVSAVTTTLTTGIVAGDGFTALDDDGVVSGAVFSDTNGTAAALTARVALLDGASQTLGETFILKTQTHILFTRVFHWNS